MHRPSPSCPCTGLEALTLAHRLSLLCCLPFPFYNVSFKLFLVYLCAKLVFLNFKNPNKTFSGVPPPRRSDPSRLSPLPTHSHTHTLGHEFNRIKHSVLPFASFTHSVPVSRHMHHPAARQRRAPWPHHLFHPSLINGHEAAPIFSLP